MYKVLMRQTALDSLREIVSYVSTKITLVPEPQLNIFTAVAIGDLHYLEVAT
jgi:hypothetical protein